MPNRIVDEAFVRELEAEQSAPSPDERFSRLREMLSRNEISLSGDRKPTLLGRLTWRLIRPFIEARAQHQREIQQEVISLLESSEAENRARLGQLRAQLALVYVKVGESLAALREDLVQHFAVGIDAAREQASLAAREAVRAETSPRLAELREEMRRLGQDLVVRADQYIAHLEEQIAALERDIRRAGQQGEDRAERLRTSAAELAREMRVVRGQFHLLAREVSETEHPSGSGDQPPHEEETASALSETLAEWVRDFEPALWLGGPRDQRLAAAAAAQFGAIVLLLADNPPRVAGLNQLLAEAKRALRPGGRLVVESANPESVAGLINLIAHRPDAAPLSADQLALLVEAAGFGAVEIIISAPPAPIEQLEPLTLTVAAPVEIETAFARLNADIKRLNAVLFAAPRYILVAQA